MGREVGGRFKREEIHVYLWLITLRFDRKKQASVKQLSFNKKEVNLKNYTQVKKKKKECRPVIPPFIAP